MDVGPGLWQAWLPGGGSGSHGLSWPCQLVVVVYYLETGHKEILY